MNDEINFVELIFSMIIVSIREIWMSKVYFKVIPVLIKNFFPLKNYFKLTCKIPFQTFLTKNISRMILHQKNKAAG